MDTALPVSSLAIGWAESFVTCSNVSNSRPRTQLLERDQNNLREVISGKGYDASFELRRYGGSIPVQGGSEDEGSCFFLPVTI